MINFADLRKRSEYPTQERLASAIGVERSTVAKWETGESLPRADKLPLLAKILGCSIDELLGPAGIGE